MEIAAAQADLRRSYAGGGPGAIVSGTVWAAAGAAMMAKGIPFAFAVLFFGGMLIFPVSLLIARALLRRPAVAKENALNAVGAESTVPMIAGLAVAYLFLNLEPAFVFPAAALAIGARYFLFRTIYADVLYVVLGGLICLVAFADVLAPSVLPGPLPFWVAGIEIVFGLVLTIRGLRSPAVI